MYLQNVFTNYIFNIYAKKKDLVLNTQQWLICHKTKPINQSVLENLGEYGGSVRFRETEPVNLSFMSQLAWFKNHSYSIGRWARKIYKNKKL